LKILVELCRMGYEMAPAVVSGGIYRLVNQCSDSVLDVYNSLTGNVVNVQQEGWTGGNNQKWKIDSLGGGDRCSVFGIV
jgi:hypothetical protein